MDGPWSKRGERVHCTVKKVHLRFMCRTDNVVCNAYTHANIALTATVQAPKHKMCGVEQEWNVNAQTRVPVICILYAHTH